MKIIIFLTIAILTCTHQPLDKDYITYIVNPAEQDVRFFWQDENKRSFKNINRLKSWVESNHKILVFAMNAGMYTKENAPQGLYIENYRVLSPLDTLNGTGNFYLKPNGIFYITSDNIPVVCNTTDFINTGKIKYATQSGPMLLIDGKIHSAFKEGSKNLNIRNGVGILPGNKIVFVMSKREVSLYDFANYFKALGCINALYLDGLVSRTYLPEKNWIQTDGNFGAIIGVIKY